MRPRKQPLAVSMGEPAGIGPDLAIQAWIGRRALSLPPFYVRGDLSLLAQRADRLGLKIALEDATPQTASAIFPKALPVVQTGPALTDRAGEEHSETAGSVVSAIEESVADVATGDAAGLVTLPINKAALYKTGFSFPGHTEFLGELSLKHWPEEKARPVMMIAGPELMVVPATIHIALKDVPSTLTTDLIVETAEITYRDMKERFGFQHPRLALCGLNPHAGENGTMGREDLDVIVPAIERLKGMGIDATGPHPADTLFHPAARRTYDCVIGMYHDQVLVPAKTIGFDDSVNVTLGLPFIRTSPDHGTAYGLAGKGMAKVDSFAASLRLASALANPDKV
ncbi:4-hydroxythreonine-4-phosphate dehydrogenase PdxA [Rhodobacterales bacterium]|nr:4-hydroxythreonine-4-phosphate dehydrogenase PdxA [Rhodobacterales bacterium]